MTNIKKRYAAKIGKKAWNKLHNHIEQIHLSRSVAEKNKRIKYVLKQWLDGDFNKWQIYHNEPGYANTNSNIESFNAAIKRDFFKRRRMTVIGAVYKLEEIIKYYSIDDRAFHADPKYVEKLNDFSLTKKLEDFKVLPNHCVSICSSITSEKYIIRVKDKSCSCSFWLKKKICVHSLAWSNLNDLDWFGSGYSGKAKTFYNKAKRGAKKGGRVKNSELAYIRGD